MKFPNLEYAISLRRLKQWEVARASGITEWRLSRLLNGRSEFAAIEQEHIANVLKFDQAWLFEMPKPPKLRIFEGETTPVMDR
jgi:hypothetical protein